MIYFFYRYRSVPFIGLFLSIAMLSVPLCMESSVPAKLPSGNFVAGLRNVFSAPSISPGFKRVLPQSSSTPIQTPSTPTSGNYNRGFAFKPFGGDNSSCPTTYRGTIGFGNAQGSTKAATASNLFRNPASSTTTTAKGVTDMQKRGFSFGEPVYYKFGEAMGYTKNYLPDDYLQIALKALNSPSEREENFIKNMKEIYLSKKSLQNENRGKITIPVEDIKLLNRSLGKDSKGNPISSLGYAIEISREMEPDIQYNVVRRLIGLGASVKDVASLNSSGIYEDPYRGVSKHFSTIKESDALRYAVRNANIGAVKALIALHVPVDVADVYNIIKDKNGKIIGDSYDSILDTAQGMLSEARRLRSPEEKPLSEIVEILKKSGAQSWQQENIDELD